MALDRIVLKNPATDQFVMPKLSELTHDATPAASDYVLMQSAGDIFFYLTHDELKTSVDPLPTTTNWDIYFSNSGSIAAQRINEFAQETTVVDTDVFILEKSNNTLMYVTAANLYSYMEPTGTGGDIYYNSSGVWTTGRINELAVKTSPDDTDVVIIQENIHNLKQLSWLNLKANLDLVPAGTDENLLINVSGTWTAKRIDELVQHTTLSATDIFVVQTTLPSNELKYIDRDDLKSELDTMPVGAGGDVIYNSSGTWAAARINEFTGKTTLVGTDVFVIQENITNNLKHVTLDNLATAVDPLPTSTNWDIYFSNSGAITAQRINEFTAKTVPSSTDYLVLQENITNTIRSVTFDNLQSTILPNSADQDIFYSNSGTMTALRINEFTTQTTPNDTDVFLIQESLNTLKQLSWSNIKANIDSMPVGTNGDYLVNESGTWVAKRINELTQKNPPITNDVFLIQEAATATHKYVTFDHLKTAIGGMPTGTNGDIVYNLAGTWTASRISELTGKATPDNSDVFAIQDTAQNVKHITYQNLKSAVNPLPSATESYTLVGDATGWIATSNLKIHDNGYLIVHNSNFKIDGENYNAYIGDAVPATITTGDRNTCVGTFGNGAAITSGTDNVFVGTITGNDVNSGNNNTYLGASAGSLATTGSNNVVVGYNSEPYATGDYSILIGVGITGTSANEINIGGFIKGNHSDGELSVNGELVVGKAHGTQEAQLHVFDNATTQDAVIIAHQDDFNVDGIIIKNDTATMTLSTDGVHLSQDDSGRFVVNAFANSGTNKDISFCNSGGNFGVGLLSPNEKLEVNGTCRATGFNANGNAGVSGSFVSADTPSKTITVTNGIITSIV